MAVGNRFSLFNLISVLIPGLTLVAVVTWLVVNLGLLRNEVFLTSPVAVVGAVVLAYPAGRALLGMGHLPIRMPGRSQEGPLKRLECGEIPEPVREAIRERQRLRWGLDLGKEELRMEAFRLSHHYVHLLRVSSRVEVFRALSDFYRAMAFVVILGAVAGLILFVDALASGAMAHGAVPAAVALAGAMTFPVFWVQFRRFRQHFIEEVHRTFLLVESPGGRGRSRQRASD